jgi:hypothetical protein
VDKIRNQKGKFYFEIGATMTDKKRVPINSATKIFSSTLGILVGLAGMEHGYFEYLQGDVRPDSIMIDAIGPAQRFWEYGTETALTIIPNFLISGILAMIIGLLVVIWAYAFIQRKFGAVILLFLSVSLFLVGGGFAPIFLTILAFVAATRINKPLKWWQSRCPVIIRRVIAKFWPWSLIFSVLMFVIAVEIAIFGNPLLRFLDPETTFAIQFSLGLGMLILSILSLPAAYAHDAQRQVDTTQ